VQHQVVDKLRRLHKTTSVDAVEKLSSRDCQLFIDLDG